MNLKIKMNQLNKKKIKVLHIITSLSQGGAQKNLYNICNSCKIQSFVICLSDKSFYSKKLDDIGVKNKALSLNTKNPFSILRILIILKVINEFKPDIIQTWLYHADFIGSIIKLFAHKLKLIWTIRHTDTSLIDNKITTSILIRILSPISYFLPNKIIYCANSSINSHKKLFYCERKKLLIHNGLDINNRNYIDPNYFKNENSNDKSSNQTIFFISIARFHPIKNHLLLLNSFKDAKAKSRKKIHLNMIGEKINLQNRILREFIISNKLVDDITLLGPKKNVYPYLKKSHFFILSSNSEAFPNVLLEASLCCIPSISTDVGDAKKILGSNGFITKKDNRLELTNAILKASNLTRIKYESLAFQTRERSLKLFSYNKMIEKYNKVYSNLTK